MKEQFQQNEGRKGLEYSGKWEKLSVWPQNQLVKFIPHFAGLTDFQFVEFSRAALRW